MGSSNRTHFRTILALLAGVFAFPLSMSAAPSLHEEIDRLIAAKTPGPSAARSSDEEFLRRAYLDLTGSIPTAAEARKFLSDSSPEKRTALIDRLLASPEYARRMTDAFTVMFMERRIGPEASDWENYLRSSFAANKPLDQLAREIVAPDPDDAASRPAALFYTKRLEAIGENPVDYPRLTRDISRLFLGKDVQCCQCHNHLTVKEYKQVDFQGLFTFVSNTYIRKDLKFPAVGEKLLTKKTEFMSVFNKEKKATGPRLPGSDSTEIEIPTFKKGEEYAVPPDKAKQFLGVPKFSPIKALGEQLPKSKDFARNMANRVWFLMMGRGVVNPLDLQHAANPPSNPELMDLLTAQLVEMKFDAKAFLREIMLSQAYQRSSVLPSGAQELSPDSFLVANLKRMSSDQLVYSVLTATGELERVTTPAPKEKAPPATMAVAGAPAAGSSAAAAAKAKPKGPLTFTDIRRRFVTAFSNPVGEPEVEPTASLAGALFISNSELVLDWLKPRPGNLVDRLAKLEQPAAVADEMYLSVLTRMPDDAERADVAAYLSKNAARRAEAVSELAWSLLASSEFCLNH